MGTSVNVTFLPLPTSTALWINVKKYVLVSLEGNEICDIILHTTCTMYITLR